MANNGKENRERERGCAIVCISLLLLLFLLSTAILSRLCISGCFRMDSIVARLFGRYTDKDDRPSTGGEKLQFSEVDQSKIIRRYEILMPQFAKKLIGLKIQHDEWKQKLKNTTARITERRAFLKASNMPVGRDEAIFNQMVLRKKVATHITRIEKMIIAIEAATLSMDGLRLGRTTIDIFRDVAGVMKEYMETFSLDNVDDTFDEYRDALADVEEMNEQIQRLSSEGIGVYDKQALMRELDELAADDVTHELSIVYERQAVERERRGVEEEEEEEEEGDDERGEGIPVMKPLSPSLI